MLRYGLEFVASRLLIKGVTYFIESPSLQMLSYANRLPGGKQIGLI